MPNGEGRPRNAKVAGRAGSCADILIFAGIFTMLRCRLAVRTVDGRSLGSKTTLRRHFMKLTRIIFIALAIALPAFERTRAGKLARVFLRQNGVTMRS